jgi:hypothetical protein
MFVAIPDSNLVKVDMSNTLPMLFELDLDQSVPAVAEKYRSVKENASMWDALVGSLVLACEHLVEFMVGGFDPADDDDWPCGSRYFHYFIRNLENGVCRNQFKKLCYCISFNAEKNLGHEETRSMVLSYEHAKIWSPELHHLFPVALHRSAKALLLVLLRLDIVLPTEVEFLIFEHLAHHSPIPCMAAEEASLRIGRQLDMSEYLRHKGWNMERAVAQVEEHEAELRQSEEATVYHDHRDVRTDQEHEQDRAYRPTAIEGKWESTLLAVLKGQNSKEMLSSFLTISSSVVMAQCYVHLSPDGSHVEYEDISRAQCLELLSQNQGVTVRTFFPPRKNPRKQIHTLVRPSPHKDTILLLHPEDTRMLQTENGMIADEVNTRYLGDSKTPRLF